MVIAYSSGFRLVETLQRSGGATCGGKDGDTFVALFTIVRCESSDMLVSATVWSILRRVLPTRTFLLGIVFLPR